MQLETVEQCRAYVEAELREFARSNPGWHAARASDNPERLRWHVDRELGDGWYTLEGRMDQHEFLIWFGNYQEDLEVEDAIGPIMRPAVHVAFEDLWVPSSRERFLASINESRARDGLPPVTHECLEGFGEPSLGDVLNRMSRTVKSSTPWGCFPLNSWGRLT